MKILSFNIHKGFSTSRRFILPQLRSAIHEVDADIVFLQEILGEHKDYSSRLSGWPKSLHSDFLAEGLYSHSVYGLNAVNLKSNHGNAILSRFPFLYWTNISLTINRFEQRGCLHTVIASPFCKKNIHCLCVHLNLLNRSRLNQLYAICERINSVIPSDEPFILAGDFNDWNERLSRVLEKETGAYDIFKLTHGTHALSFPSFYPFLRLDRVYIRGFNPKNATVLRGGSWKRLSDHLPVLVEIE